MSQSTTHSYRILTRRQRHRRGWNTMGLTETHQIAWDPAVYSGVMWRVNDYVRSRPDVFDIVDTDVAGEIALGKVA